MYIIITKQANITDSRGCLWSTSK